MIKHRNQGEIKISQGSLRYPVILFVQHLLTMMSKAILIVEGLLR